MLSNLIIHKNSKFESLVSFLEENKIIGKEEKEGYYRIKILNKRKFKSIFSTIFLFYTFIPEEIPPIVAEETTKNLCVGLKFRFRTLFIPLEPKSLDFFQHFVNTREFKENSDWYKLMEELFNSFVVLTVATRYYCKAAYPNTYIKEFKNEQEIDGILKLNNCYLFIETTFGRMTEKEESLKPYEHLKRKLFTNWFLEKVSGQKFFFLYLHTHNLPETRTLYFLQKLEDFRSICLIPEDCLYMKNFKNTFLKFYNLFLHVFSEWQELNTRAEISS